MLVTCVCMCVCAQLCLILCDAMGAAAYQAPLSMGFPRQEYWSELPFLSPEDLPDPGIKSQSVLPPELAGTFFHQ